MFGLPWHAWERFAIWLVVGLVIYFAFGYWNSTLRNRPGTGEPGAPSS
jgi:basic amino acid/polyamine antiporter, APA family